MAGKAQYTKSTEQLDLERRLDNGNQSSKVLSTAEQAQPSDEDLKSGRSYAVKGNDLDDYLGVSPEYMTYANDTEKPHKAGGDGPIADFEDQLAETQADIPVAKFAEAKDDSPEGAAEEKAEDEKSDDGSKASGGPVTSATAPKVEQTK